MLTALTICKPFSLWRFFQPPFIRKKLAVTRSVEQVDVQPFWHCPRLDNYVPTQSNVLDIDLFWTIRKRFRTFSQSDSWKILNTGCSVWVLHPLPISPPLLFVTNIHILVRTAAQKMSHPRSCCVFLKINWNCLLFYVYWSISCNASSLWFYIVKKTTNMLEYSTMDIVKIFQCTIISLFGTQFYSFWFSCGKKGSAKVLFLLSLYKYTVCFIF